MKKIFSFLAAALFAGSMMAAEPIVLTFSDWGDTSPKSETDTRPKNQVSDSNESLITTSLIDSLQGAVGFVTCSYTHKCFPARVGYGCKLGTSSESGFLTLNLDTPAEFDSVVIYCASYSEYEGKLVIMDDSLDLTDGGESNKVLRNVVYIPEGQMSSLSLSTRDKRAYVKSITFYPREERGWDGTVTPSLRTISSVADLEGIQLTFNGATTVACLNADADMVALQNASGGEPYAIWAPLQGGTYTVSGNTITLSNWFDNTAVAPIPAETRALYLADFGAFRVDNTIFTPFEMVTLLYRAQESGLRKVEAPKAQKIIEQGHVVILRGGARYNAQGVKL